MVRAFDFAADLFDISCWVISIAMKASFTHKKMRIGTKDDENTGCSLTMVERDILLNFTIM